MTPLDHNDVEQALKPRRLEKLGAIAFAIACVIMMIALGMLVALPAHGQHYDATVNQARHEQLGIYDSGRVKKAITLYEADFYADRKNMATHFGEEPDSDRYINKLDKHPYHAVLMNIESPKDHNEILRYVKLIKKAGGSGREYFLYKMVFDPRSRLEWPLLKGFQAADKWKESPLKGEVTLAVPCYNRWGYREPERIAARKFFCDVAGIESIGVVRAAYDNKHKLEKTPIPTDDLIDYVQVVNETFGQVMVWEPGEGYGLPEHRGQLEASRMIALSLLGRE